MASSQPSWWFSRSRRPEIIRMNECPTCAGRPYDPCRREDGQPRANHHAERVTLSLSLPDLAKHRVYVDARTTPYGALGVSPDCEHCDGEKSAWVRQDSLRGWVCPLCDSALDEMLDEPTEAAS